jgi:carbonic anhydrase
VMNRTIATKRTNQAGLGLMWVLLGAMVWWLTADMAQAEAAGHGSSAHEAPKPTAPKAVKKNMHGAPVSTAAPESSPIEDQASGEKAASALPSGAKMGGTVPMSALRELLDQTIAEVRARQDVAAVVRVSPKKAPAKPKPAATHAAATGHGAAAGTAANHASAHAEGAHWGYGGEGGPEKWGSLKSDNRLCSFGQRQSPIDIRDGIKVELEPIQFDYRATQFRVIDNGHTVQVNLEPGNSIVIGSRRYDLLQFHFHRPSEERINSRQFDMVAHLVHKDVQGRLAVVAVLMEQGPSHPMVQLVWNSLPLEKNTEQYAPVMLDMTRMLPERREYYTYMGSLTTPPCSEGVLWLVMKQPASMSPEQIGIFSRLYPMNARPIQSTAGRLIKESQ